MLLEVNKNNNTKLDGLQLLRAYASIIVVLRHLTKHYFNKGESIFGNFFLTGFSGVDVFFVLSGFVICYTSGKYLQNEKSGFQLSTFKTYFLKRFTRIYPIYWIVLFFPLVIVSFVLPSLNDYHISGITNFLNTMFLNFGHDKVSVVTWTLSHELFFYLCFGLVLLNRKFIYIIIPLFIYDLGNMFFINESNFKYEGTALDVYGNNFLNYFFHPINFEFLFGAIVFYLFKNKVNINKYLLLFVYIIFFLFTNYAILPDYYYHYHAFRVIFYGIPALALLYSFLQMSFKQSKILSLLILLGDASYVLYLIHNSILSVGFKYWIDKLNNSILLYPSIILLLLIIILISLGIHLWIEKPIGKFITKKLIPKNN